MSLHRQLVVDTETTGLDPADGHRIIEIACLEMIDRRLTGKRFHTYLNPMREIDAAAEKVHGLSLAFLRDKPTFKDISSSLLEFMQGAELIIHNAPFDVGFLDYEFTIVDSSWRSLSQHCAILDTLVLARSLHVGMRNSLDALCKRYKVDASKRELHGALLDTHLLAQVYLAMTGGQSGFFDDFSDNASVLATAKKKRTGRLKRVFALRAVDATLEECDLHLTYLQGMQQAGSCFWLQEDEAIAAE